MRLIDAVPVVRCKDCDRWQRHTQVNRDYGECRRFSATTKNDDFAAAEKGGVDICSK